ncbi:MAG: response regulator transcription factor [Chloroflexi bacterium]|nr:response regulator transcription factor [Chloroflexota bacterium]
MSHIIRLMIVDDHHVLREGLVSIFRQQPDYEVVAEAGTVADAVEMAKKTKPDLVLMDYGITGGTGVDATREILAELPDTKIVFLTIHGTDEELFNAIRSGAVGYLLKNISAVNLVASLRGLMHGEAPLSRKMTGRILEAFGRNERSKPKDGYFNALTRREVEILQALSSGATNQEIAESLFVSINTVKNHIHNILEKLHLDDRRAAAKYAHEHGLAIPPSRYYSTPG